MVKDITIGQYFPGSSVIHRLDPRMKLVLTLFFIVFIFVCHNFWSMGLMVLTLGVIIALSRISIRTILKGIKPVLIIILFTAVLNLLYIRTGDLIWEWKFIHLYTGGLYTAIFMVIRILALIIASSLLTYTTSPTLITDAIERLLSPLKFMRSGVHTIAMMMTIALRFIPTLIEEFDRITSAQKARGADLETGNLLERTRALIPVFIPLFITSFRRAYDLAYAMECRCYHGYEGRTRMRQMKLEVKDYVALLIMVAVLTGIILLNHYFGRLV
ncbi:MAG: energy-coupling factor transporter transmembrane protein EcfT [Clostridia bacterium]|nr:energy-coupling factor transporter transmembrane protein EcfT [Clostridia bacterium]